MNNENSKIDTPDLRKSKVMLARLTVNSWSAKRFDGRATQEVVANHTQEGADKKDIGRFNKRLILKGASEFEHLVRIEARAREAFHEASLRYDGDGIRLMPVRAYLDYLAHYHVFKERFDAALETFLVAYPRLKEEARGALNGLFSEADYPTVDQLRARYGMTLDIWPFPEAEHFNVDCLSPEAAEAIRHQIEESQLKAFSQSKEELRTRLFEVVSHMAERLLAAAEGGRLHDSALTNVQDTIAMLPKLNFLDDPQITHAIEFARSKLGGFKASYMRANRELCVPAAHAAREVQRTISQEFGIDLNRFGRPEDSANPLSASTSMALFA